MLTLCLDYFCVAWPITHSHFDARQDLLARYNLTSTYDRYVRPYSMPVDISQPPNPNVADKGKGREKELSAAPNTGSPAADTPGAGDDGDGEDNQGSKVGKKWKNNYKHLIKNLPGAFRHSGLWTYNLTGMALFFRQTSHEERRLFSYNDASATETAYNDQAIRFTNATGGLFCVSGGYH